MREEVGIFTPIAARRAPRACTVLALLVAFGLACAARAEWVWDADLGWIDMSERPADSDHGLFAYATGLFIRGDYASAADLFRRVEEKFPQSPFAVKAEFGRAKCEDHLGKIAEAAKLCDALLDARPAGIRQELDAFAMEVAAKLERSDPRRAAALLDHLIASEPAGARLDEALAQQAGFARRRGDYETVRSSLEKIAARASSPEAKYDVTFKLAVNDVAQSREQAHDEMVLRQAATRFRELLSADPQGRHAKEAQEYLDAIEGLLKEPDPGRRAVYYAVTRLLEPGYTGGSSPFKRAAKQFKGTAMGELARFYQAECLYRQGEFWSAFDVYEDFLREYGESGRRRTVVEREYAIGQALDNQHQRGKAEDVMDAVARNAANGPLADDALMFVGRAQLDRERFEDAHITFDLVVQGYPKSKWNRTAVFLSGVADLRHTRYTPDNELLLERAHRAFELYLRDQPQGPFAEQAKTLLAECKEKEAQALTKVAHFYERRREPAAAAVYYDIMTKEYPGTVSGGSATPAPGARSEASKKANP